MSAGLQENPSGPLWSKNVLDAEKSIRKRRADALNTIRSFESVREFRDCYEFGLVSECLHRLRTAQSGLDTEGKTSFAVGHAMARCKEIGNTSPERYLKAQNLDVDRKICLDLLYQLHDRWETNSKKSKLRESIEEFSLDKANSNTHWARNILSPTESKKSKSRESIEDFSLDNIKANFRTHWVRNILSLCLYMDRANSLYFLEDETTGQRGKPWYASRDIDKHPSYVPERNTINRRLLWLFDMENGLSLKDDALAVLLVAQPAPPAADLPAPNPEDDFTSRIDRDDANFDSMLDERITNYAYMQSCRDDLCMARMRAFEYQKLETIWSKETEVLCRVHWWLLRRPVPRHQEDEDKNAFCTDILENITLCVQVGLLGSQAGALIGHRAFAMLGVPLERPPPEVVLVSSLRCSTTLDQFRKRFEEFGAIVDIQLSSHGNFGMIRYKERKHVDKLMSAFRKNYIMVDKCATVLKRLPDF